MVIINHSNAPQLIDARKKTGVPTHFGQGVRGIHCYALGVEKSGIYQIRHYGKKRRTVKMKFYRPPPSNTPAQDVRRKKFAAAILAWQGLTLEQKMVYHTRTVGHHLSGYNLFIKEYMSS